ERAARQHPQTCPPPGARPGDCRECHVRRRAPKVLPRCRPASEAAREVRGPAPAAEGPPPSGERRGILRGPKRAGHSCGRA
ncbi:unnamed protein product, partial [Prorocentrum cordatum]